MTTTRPFVTAVDVLAEGRSGAVVALGDSITDGYGGLPNGTLTNLLGINENPAGVDADRRWPDELRRRLIRAGRPLAVLNAGISGNRILKDGADGTAPIYAVFGPAARSRLDADVLAHTGVTDVIVLEGINDIGHTPATGPEVVDGLSELVTRIRQAGLRVHLGTLPPVGGSSYDTPEAEAGRRHVNAWIRAQRLSHGVIDFDAAVRDSAEPDRLDPRYDSGDGLHPSPAGYRAMADAVDLSLLRGPACAAAPSTRRHATGGGR